jgi:Icc-related predicted phosphoesterase
MSLFRAIESERPDAVFLAGDLLPHALAHAAMAHQVPEDYIGEFLAVQFRRLRDKLGDDYPRVFAILGNDDARVEEKGMIEHETQGLWEYFHLKKGQLGDFTVYGYACVPPTPFLIKDWERYDVSRHLEPGDVSPEEGWRSVTVPPNEIRYGTIKKDLDELTRDDDLSRAIVLFHAPPYKTNLDRAALDGKVFDHAPLDVHVGSTAIRQFIEDRQPLLTLHGHIHESARIMGDWRDQIGKTQMFTGAHDGPQLSLVRFNPQHPDKATRDLI